MKVEVKNLSDIDYVGTFRDQPILIPAGESIEMGRAEANKFLGEYSPVNVDGAGRHKQPKKLVMVEDPEQKAERYNQPLKYQSLDGKMFRTKEGLTKYETTLQHDMKEVTNAKPARRRTIQKQPTI